MHANGQARSQASGCSEIVVHEANFHSITKDRGSIVYCTRPAYMVFRTKPYNKVIHVRRVDFRGGPCPPAPPIFFRGGTDSDFEVKEDRGREGPGGTPSASICMKTFMVNKK